MTSRRVPFHNQANRAILLPPLVQADGTYLDISNPAGHTIALICQRDDQLTTEVTVLGTTPVAGTSPGVLSVAPGLGPQGILQLITDAGYFSNWIPARCVITYDGNDYPQEGELTLSPEGFT
jgi:hypothetical protein